MLDCRLEGAGLHDLRARERCAGGCGGGLSEIVNKMEPQSGSVKEALVEC
jgi:hypothetical protein